MERKEHKLSVRKVIVSFLSLFLLLLRQHSLITGKINQGSPLFMLSVAPHQRCE